MKIFLYMCMLVASAAAAPSDVGVQEHNDVNPTTVHANPAITFVGKHNGDLERCNRENSNCEIFHQTSSPIYSLLISGEYIYAGLDSGAILRCHLNNKDSCETFYSGNKEVWSLVNARGHLYAGLVDGTILRCELQQPSCQPLHNLTYSVNSLIQIGDSIYAGLASGDVIRCSLIANNCREVYEANAGISGIASFGDSAYLLTNEGELLKCSSIRGPGTKCLTVDSKIKNGSLWDIQAFNESLYVYGDDIGICKWVNEDICESFIDTSSAWSMAITYGTYNLQNQFENEHKCTQQSDVCQRVTYYNEQERAAFEIDVERGKLRHSNYSFVNTQNADEDEGPAAIFVMAPDGKIYLSKHEGGIHTSSFLAGGPVSAAGEIVVEYGVIKKIVACSHHYKPDLELNKQVIQSLRTQGYTQPIVLEKCQ